MKRKSSTYKSSLCPVKGTVVTSPGDRAIGRMFDIDLEGSPSNVFRDLACDIFYALWKPNPEIINEKRTPVDRIVPRALVQWFLQQPYADEARHECILNTPAALAATREMWTRLMNDEILRDTMNQMQQIAEKSDDMVDGQDQDDDQDDGQDQGDQDQDQDRNLIAALLA